MSRRTGASTLTVAVVLSGLLATAAERPPECLNVAPSAGPVPRDLMRKCALSAPAPATPAARTPGDIARFHEPFADLLMGMVLNDPAVLTPFGPNPSPGSVLVGLDFDNSGTFTTLYAFDLRVPNANFYSIDVATGVGTLLGSPATFNGERISGLAADPTTGSPGTMYATSGDCVSSSSLYTVDLTNGALTRIAAMPGTTCIIDIAIDSAGQMFGYDVVTDSLYSIDKATGASTLIGSIGFDANFSQGLEFDESDGTLYMFAFNNFGFQAELRTIDTATGATTLLGVIGDGLANPGDAGINTGGVPVELMGFGVN